jgi:hypothetical protein
MALGIEKGFFPDAELDVVTEEMPRISTRPFYSGLLRATKLPLKDTPASCVLDSHIDSGDAALSPRDLAQI